MSCAFGNGRGVCNTLYEFVHGAKAILAMVHEKLPEFPAAADVPDHQRDDACLNIWADKRILRHRFK
jgi:hypothetical protein